MNKKLSILRNVSIANGEVICDGRVLYSDKSVANFKSFSKDLYRKLSCNYSKFFKMDNICKLTFLANEIITRDLDLSSYNPYETAIILSNSASTLDTDIVFTGTLNNIPSPAVFVYTLPNITVGEISIRMGWKGENLFTVAQKFNPEDLVEQTELLFASSQTELCLTGWTDYISSSDYHVSLWMVAEKTDAKSRKFQPLEIVNEFKV